MLYVQNTWYILSFFIVQEDNILILNLFKFPHKSANPSATDFYASLGYARITDLNDVQKIYLTKRNTLRLRFKKIF